MSENQCGELTKYKNTGTYQTQTYKKYQSNIKIPATSTVESPMLMITAETQYTHVIRKSGKECKSADNKIGEFDTIEECAAKCVATSDCKYFLYGHDASARKCYFEHTKSVLCSEGWETDTFNFYDQSFIIP